MENITCGNEPVNYKCFGSTFYLKNTLCEVFSVCYSIIQKCLPTVYIERDFLTTLLNAVWYETKSSSFPPISSVKDHFIAGSHKKLTDEFKCHVMWCFSTCIPCMDTCQWWMSLIIAAVVLRRSLCILPTFKTFNTKWNESWLEWISTNCLIDIDHKYKVPTV